MAFTDVYGHAGPIAQLENNIRQDRIAGAYLFTGPGGIGKSLVAMNFAKALNCLENSGDACDSCPSCLAVDAGRHPDVHIIDKQKLDAARPEYGAGPATAAQQSPAAGDAARKNKSLEIRIEDIRWLQQEICLKPYQARYKVFIINDAHNLNAESSNAFLKTLEEPPRASIIILVTDKPRLLYRTIVSRCQTVKFAGLSRVLMDEILRERLSLDEPSLRYLTAFYEGRVGRALGSGGKDIIAEKNRVIDFFLTAPNPSVEHSFIQDRLQLKSSLQVLATWFRDVYLCKAGIAAHECANADRSRLLEQQAQSYSFAQLDGIMQTLSDALGFAEHNVNTKLLIGTVLFTMRR
ncbi:MAG: DNA polymerase III subunit [Candidatus Omnitrophica bacterium]|nr:DNA polymerase III subunit [Candidatus Omnitrophota bacterium]